MLSRKHCTVLPPLALGVGGKLELLFNLFVEIVLGFLLTANPIFSTMHT
jgi:hypothetical protein